MIIAHLADLHLGFRAYNRASPSGVNVRESDVATAFAEAVEALVRIQPDLVLVAGDVFHAVRPSNAAISEAFRRFASLAARLPEVPVVIIAGDRDTPRSTDTASILSLFREIRGVVVATEAIQEVRVEALDAAVLAVPHAAVAKGLLGTLEPETGAGVSLLTLHGTLLGSPASAKLRSAAEGDGALIPESSIVASQWNYVALGHHPVATPIAPNMWYSGGIEHTSREIWAEAGVQKGFLTYDTDLGVARLHPVATREVVDLPRVSARERSAAEVDSAIAAAVDGIPGGPAGKIVRLVIEDLPRQRVRELNHRRLRDYRSEALYFLLDPRPPAPPLAETFAGPLRGQSLEMQVEEFLSRHWTPTMEGIDRRHLVGLAREYLAQAPEGGES